MAFIPVPNTAEVVLVFSWDAQVCVNTLYFLNAGGWDATDLMTLSAAVFNWWNTNIKPSQATTVQLTSVRARDLTSESAPGIENSTGMPVAGTRAGGSMPNNVSVTTSFKTALRGRNYRGRNYFIGLVETDVTANLVSTTITNNLTVAYNILRTPGVMVGATWVVVSRYSNNAPRVTGIATPVTNVITEPTVDSQRRRLPGRGA